MQIPFVGEFGKDRSTDFNAQECMNWYPVLDPGGKNRYALYPTPGLREWLELVQGKPVRGMITMGSYLYTVCGDVVYKIGTGKTTTLQTGNISNITDKVCMSENGTQVMIVEPGLKGYICEGDTVTEITDSGFPVPSSCTFQDGYFIVTRQDTGQFMISASYDGTTWNAADFATAEGEPDNLVRIVSHHNQLWLFGKETIEVWYDSGAADFPFERLGGAFLEVGIGAKNSLARGLESLFWLDQYNRVMASDGYSPVRISNRAIEYQIGKYSRTDDAIGYIYDQEGHTFYVLTFPTGDATWVYDITLQLWHQRGKFNSATGTDGRHKSNCYAFFANTHLVGDYENGKIYELDLGYFKDDDQAIRRRRTAPVVHNDRRRMFFHQLEVDIESGVGLSNDDPDIGTGDDPQAMLDWSDDGGHTWSDEQWVSMGAIGEYKWRAVWRRMGHSRNRIFRLTITDPVRPIILGAHADVSLGTN